MNESLITVRYAKALYQLSLEEKREKPVLDDVHGLFEIISVNEDFKKFLGSPIIKTSEKSKIIDKLFKGKINDLTLRFLQILVENKREDHLEDICRYIIRIYKQEHGIQEAVITTAQTLSASHRKEIFDYINKRFKMNIELGEKVDPGIIGGFVLRIEDQQINASLQSQLNKIKRELINT